MKREGRKAHDIGEFAKRVRAFRRKNGLTQEGLGKLVGVSYVTILRWENSQHKPQQAKVDVLEELMAKETLPTSIPDMRKEARELVRSCMRQDDPIIVSVLDGFKGSYAVEYVLDELLRP